MMTSIFTSDFKSRPFWWEAYEPQPLPEMDLPRETEVVIVGAGYAGLSAALELRRNGVDCVVVDAAEPGFGGSTRNGGMVSGGVNVGKRYIAKALPAEEAELFLNDAAEAFGHIEDLIAREKIECGWRRAGYFVGAWSRAHFAPMQKKVDLLNRHSKAEAYLVPEEKQREEIGSDFYRGGMVVGRAGHLHPALYFKGLLNLVQREKTKILTRTQVLSLAQSKGFIDVVTSRGTIKARDVIVATNGYTGDATPEFKRRVVPIGSYIIATEELSEDLAKALSPRNRSIADTQRVLSYYRLSPDGRRMIFGGRAKFSPAGPKEAASILYKMMTDRFPALRGTRITHAWTGNVAFTIDELPHVGKFENVHYALGCNGSGVAMMSYLGHQIARKVIGSANRVCAFDRPEFPTHPLYHGSPWFLPYIGGYFRIKNWLDRRKDRP